MIGPILLGTGTAVALAGSCIGYATAHPRCAWFGPLRGRGSTAQPPRVALTFDDGPTPGSTERVLDVLGEHDVPAAFFCIGKNAQAAPALLRSVADAGHLIANHSDDHPWSGCFHGRAYWTEQLTRANDTIAQIIGDRPRLFRPPMGLKTPRVISAARRLGMTTVTWTHRGFDTRLHNPRSIAERLTHGVGGGSILVMHDGHEPGRMRKHDAMHAALPQVIQRLRDQGLGFARLDELLDEPGYMA